MKAILSVALFLIPTLGLLTGCGRGGDQAAPELDPSIEAAKRRNAELNQWARERDERTRREKDAEELAAIRERLEGLRDARLQHRIERDKLNGKWVAVFLTRNGMEVSAAELKGVPRYWTVAVDDTEIRLKQNGPDGRITDEEEVRVTIDPSQSPKTIDLVGGTSRGTRRGIYEFDGDTLEVCYASKPDDKRPTDFTAGAGSDRVLVVWKRTKE